MLATVNGEALTVEAFAREFHNARREEGLTPASEEVVAAMRGARLDEIVDRILLSQAAREAKIVVPADRVESELLKVRADYPGSAFDEMLAQGEISTAVLKARVHQRMTIEKLIADTVYARVGITDPELEAYYQAHADEFSTPEQVRCQHIVVHSIDEARRVQAELRKGMRFEEAARRFGLGPEAKVGGELGFFARGVLPPVFDQACFGRERGMLTDVVTSEYGFHLFRIVDHRPATRRGFPEVRAQVEAKLRREKEEAAQKGFLAQLRAKAEIVVDDAGLARIH